MLPGMEFELVPALTAGIVAGIAMILVRLGLRAAGIRLRMDVLLMWGTMLGQRGTSGRLVGWAMHLLVSIVIGVVYAAGFQILGVAEESAWVWGVLGGVVHWLFGGLFLAIVPQLHPEIPEGRGAPGPFARSYGALEVAAFIAGHLAYGVVFAISYALLH
jgi:hypothetical protein